MAVETVLFDLDDTLFDHRHARRAALRTIRSVEPVLGRLSLERMDQEFERLLTEVHVSLVLSGKVTPEESRWIRMNRFLEDHHLVLPQKRVRELIELRMEAYRRHRRAVPGAPEILQRLRATGAAIAVVTNNLVTEQEEKLRVTGLEPLVDHLICSEQVGATKPDPRIFRAALRRARGRAQTAVMVGDSWESDVLGAARLGIRSVWFHRDRRPLPPAPRSGELRSFRPLPHAARVILGRSRAPRA